MRPRLLQSHVRACLDATRDADELLRDALGAKKLKELRRQRNRLAEHGAVRFDVARTPEAGRQPRSRNSWRWRPAAGRPGAAPRWCRTTATPALSAAPRCALAEHGQCEIVTLRAGDTPVAAAIVLRHQDRAFYFKLGVDERFAKFSPGVQLTLDLTRHLCADPAIAMADSTARRRSPDDQSDLARTPCDRRRADSAARRAIPWCR